MADRELYILAVDLGTGGPKVALVSTGGRVVGHEFEENHVTLLPGDTTGFASRHYDLRYPDDWYQRIVDERGDELRQPKKQEEAKETP